MSDWQPGDIALCVIGGKIDNSPYKLGEYPAAGKFYTVEYVGPLDFLTGIDQALWFKDAPKNWSGQRVWGQLRFVKVTPPEADEFDKEVIELYNKKEKPADAKPTRVTTTV